MVLVVLSEAQAMLGIADDLEGRLPLLLETASGLIEEHLNRRLLKKAYTQQCVGGGQLLYLSAFPVESVASVSCEGEAIDDFHVDADHGVLVRKSGWPNAWPEYAVTYVGGYEPSDMPLPIRQACALLALSLNAGVSHAGQKVASEAIGDYRISYVTDAVKGQSLEALSPTAASLLRPYRRIGF